jgi:hypothetical protein
MMGSAAFVGPFPHGRGSDVAGRGSDVAGRGSDVTGHIAKQEAA